MKPRLAKQRNRALTLVEVLVVMFVSCLLLIYLVYALTAVRIPRRLISCVDNLKQTGIAYRLWAGDNNDKYPMAVSVTNGGAMELIATGNVAACFQAMSNELSTTKILVCPKDARRVWATNFYTLRNANISYFAGLDVTNRTNPNRVLSGDDNFAVRGVPVKSGVLQFPTNVPVSWTGVRHKFTGNLGMADGSAQQVTIWSLKDVLIQTGVATNRLAVP
jgi:prepilin-type processing-associated H-X9-DG protein